MSLHREQQRKQVCLQLQHQRCFASNETPLVRSQTLLDDYFIADIAIVISNALTIIPHATISYCFNTNFFTTSDGQFIDLDHNEVLETHVTDAKVIDNNTILLTTTARVKENNVLLPIEDVIQTALSEVRIFYLTVNGDVFYSLDSNHKIEGLIDIAIIAVKQNALIAVRKDGQLFYYGPNTRNVPQYYKPVGEAWLVPQYPNVKSLVNFDIITSDNCYNRFEGCDYCLTSSTYIKPLLLYRPSDPIPLDHQWYQVNKHQNWVINHKVNDIPNFKWLEYHSFSYNEYVLLIAKGDRVYVIGYHNILTGDTAGIVNQIKLLLK